MMYLGSKKRLAKKLWETIKQNVEITEDTYFVDLFCGGCGMVSQVPLKNRIANDLSTPLIEYLKKITEDTKWLPKDSSFMNKEKYNFVKRNKHLFKPFFLGYVGYNFSFGGSYFQGYANTEGLPLRTYKSAVKDAEKLKDVQFYNRDYRDVPIPPKSIVYCDIPYKNTVGYNAINNDFDYKAFYEYVKKLRDEGHYVFISEYDTEVPKHFKEVGKYTRLTTMGNSAKSRVGKKYNNYQKWK